MNFRVAVVNWSKHDEIGEAIRDELAAQGHCPLVFGFDRSVPAEAQVVLTFAPYGKFLPIAQQMRRFAPQNRPLLAHWNFEGLPNPRLPWSLMSTLGAAGSWLGRLNDSDRRPLRALTRRPLLAWLERRLLRFRYVGDYFFAYHQGWLKLLASVSPAIARFYSGHGLPTQFIHWGTSPRWFDDLKLERDIDVLWLGKRRNARRSRLIDRVRQDLERRGVRSYVADSVENPFIFGIERTRLLNRAKITLNVKTSGHSNGFTFRFHMAAGNRSLIVSEAFVPQCPCYKPGAHFIAAPPEDLANTVLYYLTHENERRALADDAYHLVTTEMTLGQSVHALMEEVARAHSQM